MKYLLYKYIIIIITTTTTVLLVIKLSRKLDKKAKQLSIKKTQVSAVFTDCGIVVLWYCGIAFHSLAVQAEKHYLLQMM